MFISYLILRSAGEWRSVSYSTLLTLLTSRDPLPSAVALGSKHLAPFPLRHPSGQKKPISPSHGPAIPTYRPQDTATSAVRWTVYFNRGGKITHWMHCGTASPCKDYCPPCPAKCPDPPCIHTQVPAEGGGWQQLLSGHGDRKAEQQECQGTRCWEQNLGLR